MTICAIVPKDKLTPGYGSAHPVCQDVRFIVRCPTDITHYKRLARYNCHRPACPSCWTGWAAREADEAANRIEGYKLATGSPYDARHVTFSPPPGKYTDPTRMLDDLRDILRRIHISAAFVVPHPYRLKNQHQEKIPEKNWSNRYVEALESPTWRDRVEMSWHTHTLMFGPLPSSAEFHKLSGGWVYANHDAHRGARGRTGQELRGTIYYLLTHSWVNGNNKPVRWWFGLSTRNLGKILGDPFLEREPCPICKVDCVKVPPDIVLEDGTVRDFYQDIRNAPVYLCKCKTWEYIVKVKVPTMPIAGNISQRALEIWGPAGPPGVA